MEHSVSFMYLDRQYGGPDGHNHQLNLEIADANPLRVRATWSFHSINARTKGESDSVFFAFGQIAEWAKKDDSEFSIVKTDDDEESVRATLQDDCGMVSLLANYACYSGHLVSGRCECVGFDWSWTARETEPTVTLDLDFYGLKSLGANIPTVELLEKEMKSISGHYYMACEVNPVLTAVVARSL